MSGDRTKVLDETAGSEKNLKRGVGFGIKAYLWF